MQVEIDQRIQFVFFDFNSDEKNEMGQKVGEIFWNLTDNKVIVEYDNNQDVVRTDNRNISFRDILVHLNIGFSDESIIETDSLENINITLNRPIIHIDALQFNIYRNRDVFNYDFTHFSVKSVISILLI
jgi:hypothetical protein